MISIFIQVIPELTDVRASSICAAFPLWKRHCPGHGRQVTAQPALDSSLPRSKETVLGADCQRHLPAQCCAKIQMCKIMKS